MFCYNYPIETSKAKGFKMAKDFQKKLFNVTAKGTVLKVIANSKEAIQLNTIYNSVRLLVKLDNPIELDGQFDIVVVETHTKKLADVLTTPKEGSVIEIKGFCESATVTKGSGRWRRAFRMHKYPTFKAFSIYNLKPTMPINHEELSPVHKMGLALANNDLTTQDVFAIVYKSSQEPTPMLVDVIAAKNRETACKAFINEPAHLAHLNYLRKNIEPDFPSKQPDDHFHTLYVIRLDYKKPSTPWESFGKHFEKKWENVMS